MYDYWEFFCIGHRRQLKSLNLKIEYSTSLHNMENQSNKIIDLDNTYVQVYIG